MKIVVQVSGGLDSTILLASAINIWGKQNVFPIAFDDGSIEWKKVSCAVHTILAYYDMYGKLFTCTIPQSDMLAYPPDSEYPNGGFSPGLKLFMDTASMAYAHKVEAPEVWIGHMSDNVYPDESRAFLDRLEGLWDETYLRKIKLVCPFEGKDRNYSMFLGQKLGVPLEKTVSCGNELVSVGYNCGICDWCQKRKQRFIEAGIQDTTLYFMEEK